MNQSEVTLLGQKDNLKQHIKTLENNLQRSLEDLYIVQNQIHKVYWEDDLISEFDTTYYKIDITSMPLVPKITVLAQLHIWHKSHTLLGSSSCTVACLLHCIPCL